jgi:hypothetical protein
MRVLLLGLGLAILCSQALAQEVMWGRDLIANAVQQAGVYLTPAAERNLRAQIAKDFGEGAGKAGFGADGPAFANALAYGKIYSVGGGGAGFYVANSPSLQAQAKIPGDARPLVGYLFYFTGTKQFALYLQKFGTIQIKVNPVPPRDYSVTINGESCPATEKGEYKVMPGNSTVKVTRPTKPSCDWSGSIAEGGVQLVACSL